MANEINLINEGKSTLLSIHFLDKSKNVTLIFFEMKIKLRLRFGSHLWVFGRYISRSYVNDLERI